jgi:hypothetical protein
MVRGGAVVRGRGGSATERQAIAATVEQASSDLGARLAVDRQGAIGEIYAALGTTVLSYLQRLVGRDDAEDVLQRVFYEVWRHNGRYDPSRSLAGWVLGIACPRSNARSWCWRTSAATPNHRSPPTWTFRLEPLKRERSGACAASPNSLSRSTKARPGIAAAAPFEIRMIRRQADGRAENKIRGDSEG